MARRESRARFRHEDVAGVPRGWRVRTVAHPSGHRIRIAFPPGRRQRGAGRLVSILHPTGENPCALKSPRADELIFGSNPEPEKYEVTAVERHGPGVFRRSFETKAEARKFVSEESERGKGGQLDADFYFRPHIRKLKGAGMNPAELVVMGANPTERTPNPDLQPTKEWLLRGATEAQAKAFATKKQKEYPNGIVYMYQDPSEGGAWVVRLAEEVKSATTIANPAARVLFEEFQGKKSRTISVRDEPHMPAGDYAELGQLIELTVKPLGGGQVQGMDFEEADVRLVADPDTGRLWLAGGNQDVADSLALFGAKPVARGTSPEQKYMLLGEARTIVYRSPKAETVGETVDWEHKFGEETGAVPDLLWDGDAKRLLLEGGEYRIEPPWILN